jgi:predicted transcriptional regulator
MAVWPRRKARRTRLNVYIRTDGVKGFFARAHETARKLDKKEPIVAETVITFEDASAMWRCLTPQRTRLLKCVKKEKGTPVAHLAVKLKRTRRAVDRDISLLESTGLVKTWFKTNPGHGRIKIVEPVAQKYHLITTL